MPLTEKVVFKVVLQKENRFRVPKLVRLRYKIEPNEVLKVTVSVTSLWGGPVFLQRYAKMAEY